MRYSGYDDPTGVPTPVGSPYGFDVVTQAEFEAARAADSAAYLRHAAPGTSVTDPDAEDTTLFSDTFERASGHALDLTTATAAISSGLFQLSPTASRGYALVPGFFSEYVDIAVTLKAPSATNRAGIVARYINDSERGVTAYVSTDDTIAVGKWVAGSYTSFGSPSYTAGASEVTLRLIIDGDDVRLLVNGKTYGPYALSGTNPSGRAGLITNDAQSSTMGYDDLLVRPRPRRLPVTATKPTLLHSSGSYMAFPSLVREPDGTVQVLYVDGTSHTAGKNAYSIELSPDGTRSDPVEVYGTSKEQDCFGQVLDDKVILTSRQYDTATDSYGCYIASGDSVSAIGARSSVTFDQFPTRASDPHAAWFGKIIESQDGKYLAPVYGWRSGFTYSSVGLFEADPADLTTWTLRSWIVGNSGDTIADERNETSVLRLPDGSLIALCRGITYATSTDDGATWTTSVIESGSPTEDRPAVSAPRLFLVKEQVIALFRYSTGHRVYAQPMYAGALVNPDLGEAVRVDTADVVLDGGYMDAIPNGRGLLCVNYNRKDGASYPSLYTFEVQVG